MIHCCWTCFIPKIHGFHFNTKLDENQLNFFFILLFASNLTIPKTISVTIIGGIPKNETEPHDRCKYSDIDCNPKTILDFDFFYQENPSSDFFKLSQVLDQTENVEVIAARARICVLDHIFDKKELHNARRNGNGPATPEFGFTAAQLGVMQEKVTELRNKYVVAPWNTDPLGMMLVQSLNNYITAISNEKSFEEMMELYG